MTLLEPLAFFHIFQIARYFQINALINFKFATNFLLIKIKKPAKDKGRGFTGLDATPTVLRLLGHPLSI